MRDKGTKYFFSKRQTTLLGNCKQSPPLQDNSLRVLSASGMTLSVVSLPPGVVLCSSSGDYVGAVEASLSHRPIETPDPLPLSSTKA